ncbi:hypothetical protein [Glutamicibacter protophormiae]|uniref:SseB protein N-terminal domain-containing protein n=1 Tax=Glutamicibacter protophormiae TaxID=37930 RepID=A0ABS4XTI6_GLUPR|nr:hypothetical protein [Glutamicibacter protophormiae]MBP2399802.1 hypothetical protein [Glutamicibacter protophormiae]GGL77527.1 hypothetical protein GCM10010038_04600 [Glutamicibacter protophormiae]
MFFGKRKNKGSSASNSNEDVTPAIPVNEATSPRDLTVTYSALSQAGEHGSALLESMEVAGLTWIIHGEGALDELIEIARGRFSSWKRFRPLGNGMLYLPSGEDQLVIAAVKSDSTSALIIPIFNNPTASAFSSENITNIMGLPQPWTVAIATIGAQLDERVAAKLGRPEIVDLRPYAEAG